MLNRYAPRTDFDSYEDFYANFTLNVPENFNFAYDIVDAWAQEDDQKKALVWCDDCGRERIFTFAELTKLSNQTAHFLRGQGIAQGDRVLLILRRRYEYWITALALHKLGAVVIPASLQLTAKDVAYRVQAAEIKLVVCVDDDFVVSQVEAGAPSVQKVLVDGRRNGWLSFDDGIADQPQTLERVATRRDDTMLMYFTSGTTGMPKMVRHTYAHPLGQSVTAKYWQRVQEDKLHMSVSDSGWAKFGWGKIYGQWICGAVIFAYDMLKFVPSELLKRLQQYQVTTFCAPPTMYRFMLQENIADYDLSSIQNCGNAGEPLNPEVFNRFRDLTGLSLHEGFGQSESSVLIATFSQWFPARPGSMGKPSPLYGIKLLNADGQECEDGEEGEIVVTGLDKGWPVGLFAEYYHDDEANAKAFCGNAYHTGDMAWRDPDGYYWFVGRNDDVIKCSGYRIGPFEVESALLEHPDVVECAVTAIPDPVRGQVVKATVVLRKGVVGDEALVKVLQAHVKKVTAPYKYPRVVEFVDELPKTVSGKIKRAEIRKNSSNQA